MAKPEMDGTMRRSLRSSGRLAGGPWVALIVGLTVCLVFLGAASPSWAQEGAEGDQAATAAKVTANATNPVDEKEAAKVTAKEADENNGAGSAAESGEESGAEEQLTGRPAEVRPAGAVYGNTRIAGQFMLSFRGVSVGGNEDLYAKDIDLDDGLRIKGTNIVLTPADRSADGWYDRARLILDGIGGDPYETVSFDLVKTGLYKVNVNSRKVDYVLYDPTSPHAWNEERRMTDARVSVTPVEGLELFADMGRWSKWGSRQTSRTISSNIFAFDEDLDQEVSNLAAGVRYTAKATGTTLFFTQEFNNYKFNVPAVTTDNPGLEGPDRAVMYYLQQQDVRAMDAPVSFGGVNQMFLNGRGRVYADFLYSKQKMAFTFNRYWEGTNFAQRPMREDDTALGDATRELKHGNLTASGVLHRSVTVYGKYRRRQWDQTANQTSTESTVADDGLGTITPAFYNPAYDITMDQFAVGADFHARAFNVFGEVGVLKQDVSSVAHAGEEEEEELEFNPEETTFKVGASARARKLNVRLAYDRGDIDDPVTRISPTKVDKFNVRVGGPVTGDVSANAFFTYRKSQNPEVGCCPPGADTDYRFEAMTFGLSATLSLIRNGWITASYNYTDLDSNVPIDFPNGPANAIARYENKQHVVTLGGDYQVSETVPFSVYGLLTWLSTDGVSGDNVNVEIPQYPLGIGYYDIRLGGRWVHESGLMVEGEARLLDYEDDFFNSRGVDGAYDATIFSLGVGWRFQ